MLHVTWKYLTELSKTVGEMENWFILAKDMMKYEVICFFSTHSVITTYLTCVTNTRKTKLTGSCLMSVKSTSHIFLRQVSQSQH